MPPFRRAAGSALSPVNEAAQALGEDQDNSVFNNAMRWLSRPGHVIRSVLRGELGDAAENAIQFGLDSPLMGAGFLDRRLSGFGLTGNTIGDITTREERPEATDVLRSWGVSLPDETWKRVGIDIVGGVLTDPLTYLTFGGGGVAKGALTGATRLTAAERLAQGLQRTRLGKKALEEAGEAVVREAAEEGGEILTRLPTRTPGLRAQADDLAARVGRRMGPALGEGEKTARAAERVMRDATTPFRERALELVRRTVDDQQLLPESLGGLANAEQALAALRPGGATHAAFKGAIDDALARARDLVGVDETGTFVRFSEHAAQGELLDAGLKALEQTGKRWLFEHGLLLSHSGLRFQVPFVGTERLSVPVLDDVWGSIGRRSAPVTLNKMLGKAAPQAEEWVARKATEAWRWAQSSIFDGKIAGLVPKGLEDVVRKAVGVTSRRHAEALSTIRNAFSGLSEPVRKLMGEEWIKLGDKAAEIARANPEVLTSAEAVARTLGDGIDEVKAAVAQAHPDTDLLAVDRALRTYVAAMGQIPQELVQLGVWKDARPNAWYVPFQAMDEVAAFMASGAHNEKFLDEMRGVVRGMGKPAADVFTRARKFVNATDEATGEVTYAHQAFRAHLEEIASRHGVPIPEGAQKTDMAELMARRLFAHATTVERRTIWNEAQKRFRSVRNGDVIDTYLQAQFQGVPERTNAFSRLIGGGKVFVKIRSPEHEATLRAAGVKIGLDGAGNRSAIVKWEGLNRFYKPWLTAFPTNPSFFVRNVTSSIFLGAQNPDIGLAPGFKAIGAQLLRATRDLPLLGVFHKRSSNEVAVLLQALRNPAGLAQLPPEVAARLRTIKVGKYSGAEVARFAQEGVVSRSFTDQELFQHLDQVEGLAREAGPEALEQIALALTGKARLSKIAGTGQRFFMARAAVEPMAKLSSYIEDSFRLAGFVKLIENGTDVTEAIKQTQRAFVDYGSVSTFERFLRDMVPFARFQIGAGPETIKSLAQRPRQVGWLARASQSQDQGQDAFLPDVFRAKGAIPFGRDKQGNLQYVTGLGLPVETAADVASLIPTTEAIGNVRRVLLGGITPPVRAPLEAAGQTQFHFGGEFGSFRQAPRFLPKALTTEYELPSGRKVQEVPGWVNAWLLGAMPWSRVRFELDKWMDTRKDFFVRAVNGLTGARVRSVDIEHEARKALEAFLKKATQTGDIGQVEAFFARADEKTLPPDLAQALKALQGIKKNDRREAKRARREAELRRQGVIE